MIAVLDACVLYTATLKNLLMWTASLRLYAPRWTDAIHEEWIRNLLANRPDFSFESLQRTRQLMNNVHPECLVSGYERHIARLTLPDADDRHVVAAAIQAKATVIVTFNLSDFPNETLQSFGIRAMHPDAFLIELARENERGFLQAVRTHRASLQKPPQTVDEYFTSLKLCSVHGIAAFLETHREEC